MWFNNYAGRYALGKVDYIDEEVNDGGQAPGSQPFGVRFPLMC